MIFGLSTAVNGVDKNNRIERCNVSTYNITHRFSSLFPNYGNLEITILTVGF